MQLVETARFWGDDRVVVQAAARWRVRAWPGGGLLDEGDGAAEPEPDGRWLAVRTDDERIVVRDGAGTLEIALPAGVAPPRHVVWASDALLVVAGRFALNPPFEPGVTSLPAPATGPTSQEFGAYPAEGMSLWRLPLDGSAPTRIAAADGLATISRPTALPDGRVLFTLYRFPAYGTASSRRVRVWSPPTGETIDAFPGAEGTTTDCAASPDGSRLAFLHSDIVPTFPMWFRLALADAVHGAAVVYPLPAELRLTGEAPVWSPDGRHVAVTAFEGIRIGVVVVEVATGEWRWLAPAEGTHRAVALAQGGASALASWESAGSPPALHMVDASGRRRWPAERLGAGGERPLARYSLVRWRAADGAELEGILAEPPVGKPPWPLVVDVHGGPVNARVDAWQPQLERWCRAGFAAFAPDYRGSGIAGKARMLATMRGLDEPPGRSEAHDVLAGVDALVASGAADPARLFLFGHSAGAVLANQLVTVDRRFRAAVPWEGHADPALMFALGGGLEHPRAIFDGNPWQAPERYARNSPMARVAQVRTPLMIVIGDHAGGFARVADAVAWYTALREHGVEAKLVVYRGEGHVMQRPENVEDLFARSVAWFRAYDGAAWAR